MKDVYELAYRYVVSSIRRALTLELLKEIINRLASSIASYTMSKYEVEFKVVRTAALLSSGYLRKYHRRLDPTLKSLKRNVCPTIFTPKVVEHNYNQN